MAVSQKNSRIEFRTTNSDKQKIVKASKFVGEDMSEFILKRILPEVERILEAEKRVQLDDLAWNSFVSLLINPPKASSHLKKSMTEYEKIQGTK